jgi:YVTN family beta-propeller protein
VTNQRDGTVSVIDTTTLTVIATISTGAHCQRVGQLLEGLNGEACPCTRSSSGWNIS